MTDEDVTAERARLEALAWGVGSSPEEAARARLALRAMPAAGAVARSDAPARSDRPARSDGPARSDAPSWPAGTAAVRSERTATGSATPDDTVTGRAAADGTAAGATAPGVGGRDAADVTIAMDATGGGDAGDADGAASHGAGAGLPTGAGTWRARVRGLLWTARPRAWIALGALAVLGLTFAAGTLVGTSSGQQVAAPSTTPTPGTVTLEELLDVPQTSADQLPGPVGAPVSLRTTRLVFTNRALDGSAFETPWNVWAGVGTDRETICLVATANRLESTTACYPRDDALHGNVSLSAQSMSGTLTITVRGGAVQGTVTNEN
ncbi:hypothetical protein [Curtobacterium caseinilyticum]|uniref:Uncharacterized protein n=1 Tax=Curtobacterium caseinilyticum TaxID=3055137 RepID=A0ABT7TMM3_9MICO|nr:hypothetical protein [Curtobacterium caseinilyticum]MDM7890177.1 hypothetical protein [Curtobacterium caseinilyticum]